MRAIVMTLVTALLLVPAGVALASAGTVTLGAGQETQVAAFTLKAGDTVEYTYSAGLGVTLRVEQGGTDVFHTSGQAVHGTFTAPSDGAYAFSFRNDGAYLSAVSYNLEPKTNSGGLLLVAGIGGGVAALAVVGIALALRARKRKAPASSPAPPPPPGP